MTTTTQTRPTMKSKSLTLLVASTLLSIAPATASFGVNMLLLIPRSPFPG